MRKKLISVILIISVILSMAAIVFAGDHDDPYLMPKIVGICEIKEPLMIDILS